MIFLHDIFTYLPKNPSHVNNMIKKATLFSQTKSDFGNNSRNI